MLWREVTDEEFLVLSLEDRVRIVHGLRVTPDPQATANAELGEAVREAVHGVQSMQIMACAKRLRSGLAYRIVATLAAVLKEQEQQR